MQNATLITALRKRAAPLITWTALALLFLLWQQGRGLALVWEHHRPLFAFRYSLDYGEGPLLDQAIRLANGENIYRPDISQPPYTIANYPPLFVLAQVPFVKLFGPALWYGRVISFASVLLAALCIGLTLRALTGDLVAALAGGLTLLVFPYVLHWSALNRIDSLALGLACAGLYVIARRPESRAHRALAAGLLLAAAFTRQSYALAAPAAAFVWLLRQPPRRKALEFAAFLAAPALLIFLLLALVTRGGFFFHVVTANVNPFKWDQVKFYMEEFVFNLPLLLAGAVFFLFGGFFGRQRAWWLVGPFLLGAAASALTIGKDGSNVNYLYELCAALSLAAGALIAWAGRRDRWLQFTLLVVLAFQTSMMVAWSRESYFPRHTGRVAQAAALFRLNTTLERAPAGPVLSDEHMALQVAAGRPLVYQPFEFKMLAEARLWDQQPFVESIRRQEYPLILLYDPADWDSPHARWTQAMLDAIEENYRHGPKVADTWVLTPR